MVYPLFKSWSSRLDMGLELAFDGDREWRKMILLQYDEQTRLSLIELSWHLEILKIGVIYPYLKSLLEVHEGLLKLLKRSHDSKEFTIVKVSINGFLNF